ncbi:MULTISPECIES: exopolysaccharide biosynthesis protein [unclassified Legionella]|uniref:exopolysaccharide biosynthesis protein n=1 Tax=unclassified Legionella TaxID=2622702 RepID=UPI00105453AD|nr:MULTISPECIES: exopolysaccharide biosynthesis protein [unclassified Legionella]MDI9817979.1 exopolysaccharide biosynthesis protein [Legionella sp. PL877]
MNKVKNRISICHLLLGMVEKHHHHTTLTYGELVKIFGEQAFGLLIILFALPSALPVSIIPGFSFIFSLPIIFIAFQIIIARQALWLPSRLANRTLDFKKFAEVVNKTVPYLKRIEQLLKPRWLFFTLPIMNRLHGLTMLALSLLLLLPIPFSNFIFASLIILFGLGIAEKDGVILAFSYLAVLLYGLFLVTMAGGIIHYIISG